MKDVRSSMAKNYKSLACIAKKAKSCEKLFINQMYVTLLKPPSCLQFASCLQLRVHISSFVNQTPTNIVVILKMH